MSRIKIELEKVLKERKISSLLRMEHLVWLLIMAMVRGMTSVA